LPQDVIPELVELARGRLLFGGNISVVVACRSVRYTAATETAEL